VEISATPAPLPFLARLRRLLRLDAWPHGDQSAAVPGWVHLLFWGVLLLLDGLGWYLDRKSPEAPPLLRQKIVHLLCTNLMSAGIFYLNWMVLIPRTLARGRLGAYIGTVLLVLLAYVPLRLGVFWFIDNVPAKFHTPTRALQMMVPYTLLGLVTIFFSSALRVTGDYLQAQRNRRELERQQLLTELSLLKMQVNPHFLFNTLNNIYSLASQKSDRTPEAVLRLSEIMRYMLYESSADTVPLAKELQHLRSFLDLQRLRLPAQGADAIQFEVRSPTDVTLFPIAPMLLQPLVENAFKHGDLSARPAVRIELETDGHSRLWFVVENATAPATGGSTLERPGGVGLTNLRRRLELLYPGRHQLKINATPGKHRVQLTLEAGDD
jgi:hypothetical protein